VAPLLPNSELALRFTQRVGVGNFIQGDLARNVHGFSKVLDYDSQSVFRDGSVGTEDAHCITLKIEEDSSRCSE
jgi:hypothetical protein